MTDTETSCFWVALLKKRLCIEIALSVCPFGLSVRHENFKFSNISSSNFQIISVIITRFVYYIMCE